MKRIFTVLSFMLALMSVNANEEGHFFVDLSSQNVALTTIVNSFGSYFSYASGSTFTLFRDTTDALGIRHQSYQQYYQGKEVESHVVIVHSKNGIVRCINGSTMTQSQAPQSVVARISKRQAAAKATKKVEESSVTPIITCIDGMYYSVYKVPSPETFEILYVDSNTGEIIYRESVFRDADVVGRGYTRYNGWQNMTVYENEGKYYLMDEGKNIITMSAESGSPNTDYYLSESYVLANIPEEILTNFNELSPTELENVRNQYIRSPMMTDYIQNTCKTLYAEETNFYQPRIKSITISSAASSWWYDVWDTKPDLYCQICDPYGNVIYTTNTKEDCTLPVTFTFTKGIAVIKGCTIKIYDEDATSDSYGGSVSLSSTTPGTKTWSGSKTSGSIEIIDSPIEYSDIHWGMQKTLDFYQSKFGRNSFDDNGHIVINLAFPPKDKLMFSNMPNNASAQHTFEPYYMCYGWGDGDLMNPVVGLDVMAHEFTHMVTGFNGNGGLDYKLESGALNESFSDIMAMGVMQYTFGTCNWSIGADIMVSAPNMRSMSNPKNSANANGDTLKGAQPDTYKGQCWSYVPASIDTAGIVVHRNSGVQNYWFYLLSEGGSGTNDYHQTYTVSGIGITKALDISFRNLLFYLAPNATFEDSRNGSIQAAIDLYGKDSQEHQSVANAWHAVGVGDKYDAPTNSITVKAKMPSNWGTTISAWTWADGSNGSWATLTKEGEWYSYTSTTNPLNIIFVNGSTWNGDNNQTVDIRLTESTCIQIRNNTSGKRSYDIIDCEEQSERFVVLAQRNTSSNWFYMTSDLGTASNKRYQAVDAGTNILANISSTGLDDKYYWEIESNKLKTAAGYSTWTSGNTANLNATGKELTIQQQADGTYTFSFADGADTRYLSLNNTAGNNYFAYYKGTNQIYKLTLVKEGESGIATQTDNAMTIIPQVTKIIRNGQLFILRDGKTYTVQGQEVR